MDERLRAALSGASPNDPLCVILSLAPECDYPSGAAPKIEEFETRSEWRQARIERSQVREQRLYGGVLRSLADLELDTDDAYGGVVVIEGNAANIIKGLGLQHVRHGMLDKPISLVEPLPGTVAFFAARDCERLRHVQPMLADVRLVGIAAPARLKDRTPQERDQIITELLTLQLELVHRVVQSYCDTPVAVTVKIREDQEHFRTIFAKGVLPARIESEPFPRRIPKNA